MAWHSEDLPVNLGVSECLLGQEVRFDGHHARDRFVDEVLGEWVEWTPVCPEVEVGMGTPRLALRLVVGSGETRLVSPSTGQDFTEPMQEYSRARVDSLGEHDGYVLKEGSPSCGMERIRSYCENGHVHSKYSSGVFAQNLLARWPLLPVEEEGRLNDATLSENFVERVFCRNRWRVMASRGFSRRRLIEFHTAHKLILRAHDEAGYQRLGRLIGSLGQGPDALVLVEYEAEFQRALRRPATRRAHTNVLQHALGYVKRELGPAEKGEILRAIEDYRLGLLPLVVPETLLRLPVVRYEVEYLLGQLYFAPHPKELMLRKHA